MLAMQWLYDAIIHYCIFIPYDFINPKLWACSVKLYLLQHNVACGGQITDIKQIAYLREVGFVSTCI